jgi:hypothetical protein
VRGIPVFRIDLGSGTNMPIQKCKLKGGKSGWKWGKSGKCYSKRSDALKQMKAIKASQKRG